MTEPAAHRRPTLEVCVDSLAGVRAAAAGGADRIELCAALAVGGLTPSAALLAAARAAAGAVPVFAMVRPRDGGFTYDADDLRLAAREAAALLAAGADGLVFGAVAGGRIDEGAAGDWLATVRDAAGRAVPCTFHRAIDLADDLPAAAERVAALGFDRILTSGGQADALAGAATIRAMQARVGARLSVMAGAGVTPATLAAIRRDTGVAEFHASARQPVPAARDPRAVAFGFVSSPERRTDAATVRRLRAMLDDAA